LFLCSHTLRSLGKN